MNNALSLLGRELTLDKKEDCQDKKTIFGMRIWLVEIIASVLAFLIILFSYMLIRPLNQSYNTLDGAFAKGYGFILMAIVLTTFIVMFIKQKINFKRLVIFIFLAGFILRLTYMLYTRGELRQYDTWTSWHDGHYDYALSFYLTGALPTEHISPDTIYQFYHPPLNAFIQGMFMHFFKFINLNAELEKTNELLFTACQVLACFYMYMTSLFFTKTIWRTKLSNGSKLLAISVVSLYPRLVQLSGQLNNDAISIMFSAIAIYYFWRWYNEEKKWSYHLLTALFVGLALMSKLSAAGICLGMAIGYLIELIRSILRKDGSLPLYELILQYAVFLIIASFIGLWWQLYTHYVYGLPFNFVFNNLNAALFTGTRQYVIYNKPESLDYYDAHNGGLIYTSNFVNFFVRFILPIWPYDFKYRVFCYSFENYNILSFALRSSVFGEHDYWYSDAQALAVICVIAVYLAYFSMVISIIYFAIKKKSFDRDGRMALYLLLGLAVMYLYLQITMPYGCSMDFRYIVPSIFPAAYLFGKTNDYYKEEMALKNNSFAKNMKLVQVLSVTSLLVSSYLFYCVAI